MKDYDFLSDSTEQTSTRFVTFITPGLKRFDLALLTTNRFYGKKLVTDLMFGRSAILGPDDLEEEGVLEAAFRISEEEAAELAQFLTLVLGAVNFTD
ncbi:cytosolic protein [Cohnella sp. CIP 111063]|nr:cytosolic protein [Cohnella sp. CIP 111063]